LPGMQHPYPFPGGSSTYFPGIPTPSQAAAAMFLPGMKHPYTFPSGNFLAWYATSLHLPRRQWQRFCQVCNITTPSPAAAATFLPGMQHPHTFPGGSGNVFARYATSLHLPRRQQQSF